MWRKTVLLFSMLSFAASGYSQADSLLAENLVDEEAVELIFIGESKVDSVLAYAEKFLGVKYGYGSSGTKSFDCSGFVMHVYGQYGIQLPHGSGSQEMICETIKLKKVRPGDLLFFSGRKISKTKIGHVAIVKEVDGRVIKMIHATVQAGVIVEELDKSEYFSKRFIKAGRISVLENGKKKKG